MIRRRTSPDGLPFYLYEYFGVRTYSIGYKPAKKWVFRYKCDVADREAIQELRRKAIHEASKGGVSAPAEGTFAALADEWLKWQRYLPDFTEMKRADSTLKENERELVPLKKAFGHMQAVQMLKSDAYRYLDACLMARDKEGNLRPRPAKGNKEISLARTILEFGVRRGWLRTNPFDGVQKLVTKKSDRLVSDQELSLAVEVGRRMGGPQHIVALACKTAWLCLKRSVEVRALTRDQFTDQGIVWKAAKRQRGQADKFGVIEWSDELRATIDEALAIPRNKLAGSWYVFGGLKGQRYTKGGWKATLSKLMIECVAEAERRRLAFMPFSLQDCRPMGVTTKKERGDDDVQDATMHSSARMVDEVYDRRRLLKAKPAK